MSLLVLTGGSEIESIFKLIGLLVLCILIIAASFFVTKFIGKRQMGAMGESNFESLDVYRLNQNKYLQLIRIGKRYFVIAVGKDTVTTIAELSEEDIVYRRENGKKISFKEIMAKATGGLSQQDSDKKVSEASAEDILAGVDKAKDEDASAKS